MSNLLYDFGNLLTKQFGSLGQFGQAFDQNAQRSYSEEGYFETNPFNPTPKQIEILMQTPDITVFVKKRAFGSLAENYRTDLMDMRERALYRTTKILFQNKCAQIQNYERLTKLAQVSMSVGQLDTYLLPILFTLTDNITQLPNVLGGSASSSLSSFASIVNRVREVVNLSNDNINTTWITDLQNNFLSTLGPGTGVIELTNITLLSTTTSIKFGQGKFNLSISDPYKLMLITNNDIEQAISDATNAVLNSAGFQLGITSLNSVISLNKQQLNSVRAARGAAPITFIVNSDTISGSPVIAVIESLGFQIQFSGGNTITSILSNAFASGNSTAGVNIDPSALQGSQQLGDNGLSPQEASLFAEIITEFNNQIQLNSTATRQTMNLNQDPTITYVRQKLRQQYGGRPIIQIMDNVNVYIRSYKTVDAKIAGLITDNMFNSLANTEQNISDAFNLNNNYAAEKSIYVGSDCPSWLWFIIRPWFVSDNDGAHVFAGLVDSASSSFDSNSGTHQVQVAGSDNSGYFNYGVVNIQPSLDVYNGPLFDPLTPFDIKFDSVTGVQTNQTPPLLDENVSLFTSAFTRYKNGLLAGIPPAQNSYFTADAEQPQNNSIRQVFYDPDGMVYRWKEGIATLILWPGGVASPAIASAPAITVEPFAGQDIMNILSLLICGEPYNYSTFYKAVQQFDSGYFSRDPASNADPSKSYFRSLQNNLKYRNEIYGHFIPFKSLVVDDQTYAKMLYGQLNVQQFNSQLQSILQQRAAAADQLVFLQQTGLTEVADVSQRITNLNVQMQGIVQSISNQLSQLNQPVSIVGNDFSFSSNPNLNTGGPGSTTPDQRKALRQRVKSLTRRMSWRVRANEDTNYLIVDDTYDKDYDIQAFEKAFTNPELFKSKYDTVADQIKNVAEKLQLEVFANSQGHIEIRNPKYNNIPSSVLYNMFFLNNELGIQVYPQFLEDLYVSQIESLQTEVEVFEDQVRLYCLVLGFKDDPSCENFITGNSNLPGSISLFSFLSDPNTGSISTYDFSKINYQANPSELLSAINNILEPVEEQSTTSAFTIATQVSFITSISATAGNANNPNQFNNIQQTLTNIQSSPRYTTIINRLQQKTGQMFDISQITGSSSSSQLTTVSNGELLNITNQISSFLQQRQTALQAFVKALQNAQEGVQLNQDGSGSNQSVSQSLTNTPTIPQVFDSMIEDETYDDYGPGAAKRFIIRNRDILHWEISENRPEATYIEVTGRLGEGYIANSQLPSDLNVFQNGGSALTTTGAIDYDMYRMYGIWKPQSIDAPFLYNPDTQCGIYAVSILNRIRHEIFKGNLDLIGNEYQQPGEVIYIEELDKLFYIESVTHQFSYGSQFTTNVAMGYGRSPGEFIPSPLDVIGKILYKNKDITNFTHKRQNNVFNQQYMGSIVGNYNGTSSNSSSDDILNGPYGDANRKTIQQIISASIPLLSTAASNFNPVLELRVFFNDNSVYSFGAPSNYAMNLASSLYNLLTATSQSLSGDTNPAQNTNANPPSLAAFASPSANPTQVRVQPVNSNYGGSTPPQPPSQPQQQIDNAIYNYIVDCWIIFNNPSITLPPGEFRYPSTQAYHYARDIVRNQGGTTNI